MHLDKVAIIHNPLGIKRGFIIGIGDLGQPVIGIVIACLFSIRSDDGRELTIGVGEIRDPASAIGDLGHLPIGAGLDEDGVLVGIGDFG